MKSDSTPPEMTTLPPVPAERTIIMPEPPKNHRYIAVPDDIRADAITSDAVHSLCRIASGEMIAEISEKLPQLITACGTLNRKGGFSLKIQISPGGMGQMEIGYDCDIKPPKEKKHPSLLFCSTSGQLLSRDPAQMEMELRSVPMPERQPLRVVEAPEKQLRRVGQ